MGITSDPNPDPASDSTTATLFYAVPPDGGVQAYSHPNADPITGLREYNVGQEGKQVEVENLRGREHTVSLDTAAFQFFNAPSKHKAFTDDEEVEREYYPESSELIKNLTGASRVVLFDHTIRRHRPGTVDDSPLKRQPVAQVHVDQTLNATIARVHRHLPADEAPELLKRRFQIINLWRPISHAAYDRPLALCDYRSVDPERDTFPVVMITPERVGETMGVRYDPGHRWKYLRGMTPDEIVLIKCCDSKQDGRTGVFAPHASFEDPTTPPDAPLRESIEIRALVFYEDE